jgi:YHS domain-containing protein
MESTPQPVIIQTACGGILQEPENYPSAEYDGKRVYFCTLACLRAFEQNPDAFMKGEVEHPLGEE